MKWTKFLLLVLICTLFAACGKKKASKSEADYNTIKIACDETFSPIMGQEMRAFHAKYPEAIIDSVFLPETTAMNQLLKDSIRMIIATRPLSEKEKSQIRDAYKLIAQCQPFAYDAVALIVNKNNSDTLISVDEIRKIVTGKISQWSQIQHAKTKGNIEVVFDNENSSTVRYIRDSICGGAELKGNLKTGHTNQEVIKYVSQTRNAIGIIGVDWIRNLKDSSKLSFDQRVHVMSVSNSAVTESDNCFQPVQYYIATGDYPLIRKLYVITTDPRDDARSLNFYYYLTDTEGQLIITKSSQLLPIVPVQVKQVNVNP